MGILQRGIEDRIGHAPRVVVVGIEGPEGLMAATPIALGLETEARTVALVEASPDAEGIATLDGADPGWAGGVAEWYAEQRRPVTVHRWGGDAAALPDGPVIAVGDATLLDPAGPGPRWLGALAGREAIAAVVGLGAEGAGGADPDAAPRRLTALAATGGVLAAELIPRFGMVGRHFVELVEHVHHRAGPTDQSRIADTVRASLFGRHGDHPVSLATRDRPPRVGIVATLVFFLDVDELRSATSNGH